MRRVVITGLGSLTPFGMGVDLTWNSLLEGKSAISKIEKFDASDYVSQIAGQVIFGEGKGQFNPDLVMEPKEQRRVDDFVLFALAASQEAVDDADWKPESEIEKNRTGVIIGSGIGGLKTIYSTSQSLFEAGPRRISPFFIPSSIINMASGHVSIRYGFKGPNMATVTACATGAHAIINAYQSIVLDDADVIVAGGAESAIYPLSVGGFAQARALSHSYNDNPQKASRPWDKGHDGFVISEGAGIVVLEEYEHAIKRGAKIYAEIVGYGCSGDAYHITSPAPDGNGARRAMQQALQKAGLKPQDVDYINAHGTSTMIGDAMEAKAVSELFVGCDNLRMSSTKSAIGHMLGAAGAVEAIFCAKAIEQGIVPPTLNLEDPIEEAKGMNLVANQAQKCEVKVAMSNSFGFGGTNASLILKKL
ncbi:MAG: beta-ketoacyl-ACP synthase II [Alphaproteobacteria bacterium]|nr:beta-ketoacyl-ACP synthase II [Alphaproteobacteria bacterium]